jgi:Zn-dependent oligopeptidase
MPSSTSLDLALLDRAPLRRWGAVHAEDVPAAVDAALDRARADLAELKAASERTYENTLQALDDALERVDRVYDTVRHLVAVATTPALREAHHRAEAPYQSFRAAIPTDPELWAALRPSRRRPQPPTSTHCVAVTSTRRSASSGAPAPTCLRPSATPWPRCASSWHVCRPRSPNTCSTPRTPSSGS